jgi:hypothetical protein
MYERLYRRALRNTVVDLDLNGMGRSTSRDRSTCSNSNACDDPGGVVA